MSFCQKCGTENADSSNFCSKCGNSLTISLQQQKNESQIPQQKKSWSSTLLLCWLLGFFGIHRFYVGKIGTGLIQLFTFAGFGIWWFIDWIMILANNFTDQTGTKIIRKSGDVKNVVVVFVSITAVFVLAVIGMGVLAGGNNNSDTTESVNFSENDSDFEESSSLYNVGDTLKSERTSLIVTSIKSLRSINGDFLESEPSEGAIYLTVQYKYKNISGKAIGMFSKPSISLIDPNGNDYDADIGASSVFATVVDDNEKVLSDLNPGITVKSSTVFEVSEEALKTFGWYLSIELGDSHFKIDINSKSKKTQNKVNQQNSAASSAKSNTTPIKSKDKTFKTAGICLGVEIGDYQHLILLVGKDTVSFWLGVEIPEGSISVGDPILVNWVKTRQYIPEAGEEMDLDLAIEVNKVKN